MGGSMGVTHGMVEEFGPERVRNTPISEMALAGARSAPRPGACARWPRSCTRTSDARRGANREPGGEAPLHVGRSAHHSRRLPHAGRRRLVARSAARAAARGLVRAHPGLKVVFASTPEDVRGLLWSSIYDDNPVVFFEHRTLYGIKGNVPEQIEPIPLGKARTSPRGRGCDGDRDRTARPRVAEGGRGRGEGGSPWRSSTLARCSRSTRRPWSRR